MMDKRYMTFNWDHENREYEHFTDIGHYMLEIKDISVNDIDDVLASIAQSTDVFSGSCSATAKKNDANEVLMSHSMDVEVSQKPGFITRITDGKYDTTLITYLGAGGKYSYTSEGLAALDEDVDYLKIFPFKATDALNEAGLYVALDMRPGDSEGGMDCPGTNPGKKRASVLCAPSLVALNCATVKEAVDYLRNEIDWYTMSFVYPESGITLSWNMGLLMGDATGEYGLVEFGRNGVYFTPYQNFQSNYYIHPMLAERATINHGHGRAAALLEGLVDVQTENDIYENQKRSRYHIQMYNPSPEYYSDAESLADINVRRKLPLDVQAEFYDEEIIHTGDIDDNIAKLRAYQAGDERAMRDDGYVWMGTITTGVNCAKKHAMIEMWENRTIIDIQYR